MNVELWIIVLYASLCFLGVIAYGVVEIMTAKDREEIYDGVNILFLSPIITPFLMTMFIVMAIDGIIIKIPSYLIAKYRGLK